MGSLPIRISAQSATGYSRISLPAVPGNLGHGTPFVTRPVVVLACIGPMANSLDGRRFRGIMRCGEGTLVKVSTFLICPVRGHDIEETRGIVVGLEAEGWRVHWPPRDTNQEDDSGYRICSDNREAIRDADCVHFIWDGKSQGGLFDLGMAFSMNKPVVVISVPELTEGKSFQNMVTRWAEESDVKQG